MYSHETDHAFAIGHAAEKAAATHFERLEYLVGRFGVENLVDREIIRKFYYRTRSPHVSAEFLLLLRSMPDLIIARESLGSIDVQPELSLVEVKYRKTVELDNRTHSCTDVACGRSGKGCGHPVLFHIYHDKYTNCLRCQYQRVIEYGFPRDGSKRDPGNVLFYLIADHCSFRSEVGPVPVADRIFLNLAFIPQWVHGDDARLRGEFPMYVGRGTNFADLAGDVIREFDIAKNQLEGATETS